MAEPRTRNERWIFQAPDLVLGEFCCLPGDPAWGRANRTATDGPLIAVPRTSVWIRQEGRPEIVADQTRAVLYPAGQPYRRALVAPDGDRCSYIGLSHALAADAASGLDPRADDPATYRFPFAAAPIDSDEYLLHETIRRRVAIDSYDHGEVREALYSIVARVVERGYGAQIGDRFRRPSTYRAHAEVVDAVRVLLGRELGARISLDGLAASVNLSPFHLSRVFREQAGFSVHGYRVTARLRASLARIADGVGLADVAADLGFASQAHFTDRFKRAYGSTPQAWRLGLKTARSKTSRNLEEEPGVAHIA